MEEIFNVRCEHKNAKTYIFTDDQKRLIIQLYKDGNSTVTIGKMFNVSHKTIARVLESFGIKRTGVGKRKYKLNEEYFDSIDTPNKAYILGFLYADGYNSMDKSTVSMSLQEEDRNILELIREETESEKELEYIDYSNKHDFGYSYKNQYRLLLFSHHICDALNKHGMHQNKSLILSFPDLHKDLIKHFVRGYFDGDGSVCRGKRDTQFVLTITSTSDFCESLKKYC